MDDVWYSPEKYDLTFLFELEDPNASYSFDKIAVWEHQDGTLYWGMDSGCSCPSPFEDKTIDDLKAIDDSTWVEFQEAVENHCLPYNDDDEDVLAPRRVRILSTVARKLRPNWQMIPNGKGV